MFRRNILLAGMLVVVATSTGCHKHKNQMRGTALDSVVSSPQFESMAMDGCAPTGKTACVDRHPMLYKPRDVFNNVDHGPIMKTAAATFVGVPAGIAGEVGQVFHGCPRCAR